MTGEDRRGDLALGRLISVLLKFIPRESFNFLIPSFEKDGSSVSLSRVSDSL